MTVAYNPKTGEYKTICNIVVPKGGAPCVAKTWKGDTSVGNAVVIDSEITANMDSQDLLSGQNYQSDGGDVQ